MQCLAWDFALSVSFARFGLQRMSRSACMTLNRYPVIFVAVLECTFLPPEIIACPLRKVSPHCDQNVQGPNLRVRRFVASSRVVALIAIANSNNDILGQR